MRYDLHMLASLAPIAAAPILYAQMLAMQLGTAVKVLAGVLALSAWTSGYVTAKARAEDQQ